MSKNNSKHILIIGANSFIAKELAKELSSAHYKLTGTYNRKNNHDIYDNYIPYSLGGKLPKLHEKFDTAIYLAHDFNKSSEHKVINATKDLYQSLKGNVANHIFISSYSAAKNSQSAYGRSKYELEQFFIKEKQTIIRPGLVLGNGGLFARIIKAVNYCLFVPMIGTGKGKLPIIGINNLTDAIIKIIKQKKTGEYNIFYNDFISLAEIVTITAKAINKKRILIPIPESLIIKSLELFERLRISFPVSSENVKGFVSNQQVNSKYTATIELLDETRNIHQIIEQYINSYISKKS